MAPKGWHKVGEQRSRPSGRDGDATPALGQLWLSSDPLALISGTYLSPQGQTPAWAMAVWALSPLPLKTEASFPLLTPVLQQLASFVGVGTNVPLFPL